VIAKNTVEALQSGMVFGVASQVEGIVARMIAELGRAARDVHVVATGYLAPLVSTSAGASPTRTVVDAARPRAGRSRKSADRRGCGNSMSNSWRQVAYEIDAANVLPRGLSAHSMTRRSQAMAQKVHIVLEDDLDAARTETVSFGLRREDIEDDLNDKNAGKAARRPSRE
jgi:hypothetical protein